MLTINIHEAKTHLSRLIEAAAKGESFIIAKAGKPMVKVVAIAQSTVEGVLLLTSDLLVSQYPGSIKRV